MRQPQQNDKWINLSIEHEKEISDLQGKLADLKAENERLIWHADSMAKALEENGFNGAIKLWNKAKKGRDAK